MYIYIYIYVYVYKYMYIYIYIYIQIYIVVRDFAQPQVRISAVEAEVSVIREEMLGALREVPRREGWGLRRDARPLSPPRSSEFIITTTTTATTAQKGGAYKPLPQFWYVCGLRDRFLEEVEQK